MTAEKRIKYNLNKCLKKSFKFCAKKVKFNFDICMKHGDNFFDYEYPSILNKETVGKFNIKLNKFNRYKDIINLGGNKYRFFLSDRYKKTLIRNFEKRVKEQVFYIKRDVFKRMSSSFKTSMTFVLIEKDIIQQVSLSLEKYFGSNATVELSNTSIIVNWSNYNLNIKGTDKAIDPVKDTTPFKYLDKMKIDDTPLKKKLESNYSPNLIEYSELVGQKDIASQAGMYDLYYISDKGCNEFWSVGLIGQEYYLCRMEKFSFSALMKDKETCVFIVDNLLDRGIEVELHQANWSDTLELIKASKGIE